MEDTNLVSVDTLKEHGFTDEDLAAHITPEPETKEETSSEPVTDVKPETEEPPPAVTTDEKTSQVDGDTVNQLKPSVIAYDRFKEVNDRNKQLAAEIAALKAQYSQKPQEPQQPQAPQVTPDQYFTQRHNFLAGKVAEVFRTTPDQLGDDMQFWTPAQRLAYERMNNQLTQVEQREEQQRQEAIKKQQTVESFTASLESELMAADPAAYDYAINKIKSGEVLEKDKKAIIAAIQTGDKDTIKKHFDGFRAEYQAKIQPTPPAPSPLDKAAGLPKAQNLSGAKTAAMSWAQVEQLIREGKSDQIPVEMLKQIDPKLV